MKTNWNGKRVLVLGAARQGQAATRWLARHGARVTLNDRSPEEQMSEVKTALADVEVTWVLGSHPVELLEDTDILCLSGGVPMNNPIVSEALKRGMPVTNDTQVFMEVVPCKTIGITGSAGKTTTTTLVGRIAHVALGEQAYVGGNIGDPLLNYVDQMQSTDLAILEISSFQLEQMTLSPDVAAILNITPNHLDRHGTMEAYTAAKLRNLDFQAKESTAVLGRDDTGAWNARDRVHGRLISFGKSTLPQGGEGTILKDGMLQMVSKSGWKMLMDEKCISLRGEHNLLNVLAACALSCAVELPVDTIRQGVEGFPGVAHRLEFVREWHGAKWYNDSIATAPERSMAAIRSFTEPIVLLLGGRDKNLPWKDLANLVLERVAHVVLFGEASAKIEVAMQQAGVPQRSTLDKCKNLETAVQTAARLAGPGDVVLLSPGGTSFDEFRDFEERGEWFRKWVSALS